jgi:hypothetical protein
VWNEGTPRQAQPDARPRCEYGNSGIQSRSANQVTGRLEEMSCENWSIGYMKSIQDYKHGCLIQFKHNCIVQRLEFFSDLLQCLSVVKGPAADATEAPQPWGLLCNPVMKMISFFCCPCNGAPVEWNWQGKTVVHGEKPAQFHFVHHKSHMEWPEIDPGPPQWDVGD